MVELVKNLIPAEYGYVLPSSLPLYSTSKRIACVASTTCSPSAPALNDTNDNH